MALCDCARRAAAQACPVQVSGAARRQLRHAEARPAPARLAGLGQHAAQLGQRRAQLVAMHHHVDHAVVEQIFGSLEAVGQLLADGLLDHARAGEADQRAGLGDVHVAQHRIGGGDAAGGRIGQHDDVGPLGLAQHLHRHRGARQLHQREDALLHARAAGGREHDERRAAIDRGLEPGDDRLARRHAERAAHEVEILHADRHRHAFELAEADLDRVGEAGLGARVLETVGVAALVAELERIDRDRRHRDVEPGLAVEDRLQPRHRAHAHVVVRARDDELVGLDVLVEHELAGLRTLDPEIFRRLAPVEEAANLRPDDVGDPVHGRSLTLIVMAGHAVMTASLDRL